MENKSKRVLGYQLATKITHEEMNEVAGGKNYLKNHTFGATNEYTHPIGTDVFIDRDCSADL